MKEKFTQGEWYVPETDCNTPLQVVGRDAKRGIIVFNDEFNKEDKANAHLIAAAPDMYRALEALVKGEGLPPGQTIERILAKARGES